MKTAMQEAIDRLLDLSNSTYFNGKKSDCDIIDRIQLILKNEYLPKEREQIESAIYNVLYREMKENSGCVLEQEKDMFRDTAKEYYSTTFKK